MSAADELSIDPGWQRRLLVEEYHQMVAAGVFDEDERLELLDGLIVAVSPQGVEHAMVIERLNRLLVRRLGDEYRVRPQLPLTLRPRSEPEPDLAVVAADGGVVREHPNTALLVIEVAGESLAKDRGVKAALYARGSVAEYWVIDLSGRAVHLYAEPDPATARYRKETTVGQGGAIVVAGIPGLVVEVAEIF